jgi:hypothetical protein
MKKSWAGYALTILCSCMAKDNTRAEVSRMANKQEMQIVLALVNENSAADKAYGKFTKHEVEKKPVWSRMLPLQVVRTDKGENHHPAGDRFVVPLKELVDHSENARPGLALRDSTYLFQQVRKAEILLDSTAFEPGTALTPQQYEQPQVRRRVHGHRFYRFSQPLFSPDGNSAYIQMDAAGSRGSYRLSKKGGKWVVTHTALLWVE